MESWRSGCGWRWKIRRTDIAFSRRYISLNRGRGKNPDKLWNYPAVGTASDPVLTVSIPDYVAVWGLDLPSYQVHARFILLDTETGYRSQYLAVSGVIEL